MNKQATFISPDLETRIESLLDELTLEEQVLLLSGEDFWTLPAIPRLGIGKLRVTDGPNGARGGGSLVGGKTAAAFPIGIALGATWDVELIREIGGAIAEEVKSKGAQVALAPTINIQRSVTNGRNFECYSEDPELSAAITVAYVEGLQTNGVSAMVKHYAGNESEIERTTINSVIDERSLREVYLRPFEAAVKEAGTWGIMSSYNRLNGIYAAENDWLLTDVLRGEWRYDGVVMSDWFGSRATVETINAGLDIEMPGPTRHWGQQLLDAIAAGEVTTDTLRERVRVVLRLIGRIGLLDHMPEFVEQSEDKPEHRALIRRAGAAGAVLLKNDGILPLAKPKATIAAIGPNASVAQIMGGGSSQLNPHYRVSPLQGLQARLGDTAVIHAPGCQNHRWEPLMAGEMHVEFFDNTELSGPVAATDTLDHSVAFWVPPFAGGKVHPNKFSARLRTTFTVEESGPHSFGIHAAGKVRLYVNGTLVVDIWDGWTRGRTFFEEGCDEQTGLIDLVAGQEAEVLMEFAAVPPGNLNNPAFRFGMSRPLGDAAIAEAVRAATEAETAILFVGRNGEWDTEGSDLPNISLPGDQDALVAAVAAANPRTVVVLQTGGPVEMPWVNDVAAVLQAWYPGQECGNAITDVLFGDAEPGGRLPQTFPAKWSDNPAHSADREVYPGKNGNVRYAEGVFIGYRHYDAKGLKPLFPFGHGLSYTSFEITDFQLSGNGAVAAATVRNTGDRAGSTVVQVYVGAENSFVDRPVRELKGFAKVDLAVGAEHTLTIPLAPRAYAYFDTDAQVWRTEEGQYTVSAGFSATDLRKSITVCKTEEVDVK